MIAARILGAGFSMTLHGSDLLVRADYLDVKLPECRFCFTISDFNRRYILAHYPSVAPAKILVQHLGIDISLWRNGRPSHNDEIFSILSVGRLHAVKNHGFLLLGCHALKNSGVQFRCAIAGDGEERVRLEQLTYALGLEHEVTFLGHVQRKHLPVLYAAADVVVLTSHSEGVPVTLMEAMAMERLVIAPRISGIPELVTDGEDGFLFEPNSMDDFLEKLQTLIRCAPLMHAIRRAARQTITKRFNASVNFADFASRFLELVDIPQPPKGVTEADPHENPVLQQI
jgi:glycosyltransferase involved in cell wall biosynthesis